MNRLDKILELAAESSFYRNEDGFYRIMYTEFGNEDEMAEYDDDGTRLDCYFDVIEDDDRGEEYRIYPHQVKDSDSFYKSVAVKVKDAT